MHPNTSDRAGVASAGHATSTPSELHVPDQVMASLHDRSGVLRAYGVAESRQAAAERARDRLRDYLAAVEAPVTADAGDYDLRFVPLPEARAPGVLERDGGLLRSALRRRRR